MTETLNDTLTLDDKNSISVQDFCKRAKFSLAYFYKIKKAGATLPPIQKTDKSSRILLSDAKEWDKYDNEFPELTEENSISVDDFVKMHEICWTTYNKLKAVGLTPTAYKPIPHDRILLADVEEWESVRGEG